MQIVVTGIGELNVTPDQIILDFEFQTLENSYEKSLKNGVKEVENYINLLINLGFKKEDLKTQSFNIHENTIYNSRIQKWEPDGMWDYQQRATIEFNDDLKLLSRIMEETSNLTTYLNYKIYFSVKNKKRVDKELLKLAYEHAEFQAKSIAEAANKKTSLKCTKITYEPFERVYTSRTMFEKNSFYKEKKSSFESGMERVFVPEDIRLSKTIYCSFEAE